MVDGEGSNSEMLEVGSGGTLRILSKNILNSGG